jgi:hypothetical protein
MIAAQCCRRCCTVTYGDSADIGQGEVIAQQAPKAKEFTPVRAFRHRALSERQVPVESSITGGACLPGHQERSSAGTTQVTKAWPNTSTQRPVCADKPTPPIKRHQVTPAKGRGLSIGARLDCCTLPGRPIGAVENNDLGLTGLIEALWVFPEPGRLNRKQIAAW